VFELDFAYSTVCAVLILSSAGIAAQVVGGCMVEWCLDSPCGVGVSTASWFGIYPFVLQSQYQWGDFLPVDLCVDMVHWMSLWGEIKSVYLHVV